MGIAHPGVGMVVLPCPNERQEQPISEHIGRRRRVAQLSSTGAGGGWLLVPGVPVYPDEPAEAIKQWAETLTIPDGIRQGEHFQIADWQHSFLTDALRPETREACLSVARKNGKSALVALMLLAYLSDKGPLHRHGWRGLVVSSHWEHLPSSYGTRLRR